MPWTVTAFSRGVPARCARRIGPRRSPDRREALGVAAGVLRPDIQGLLPAIQIVGGSKHILFLVLIIYLPCPEKHDLFEDVVKHLLSGVAQETVDHAIERPETLKTKTCCRCVNLTELCLVHPTVPFL